MSYGTDEADALEMEEMEVDESKRGLEENSQSWVPHADLPIICRGEEGGWVGVSTPVGLVGLDGLWNAKTSSSSKSVSTSVAAAEGGTEREPRSP